MRDSFRKMKICCKLLSVLAVAIFFAMPALMTGAYASAASYEDNGARMIDNGDGTRTLVYTDLGGVMKEVLRFDFTDEDCLIMTGKHNPSQSRWHYYTAAYTCTGKSTNRDMEGYSGAKVRVERVAPEPDVMSGGMLVTTYRIKWTDIIAAAEKCFTPKQLSGKVTLYMSNVC